MNFRYFTNTRDTVWTVCHLLKRKKRKNIFATAELHRRYPHVCSKRYSCNWRLRVYGNGPVSSAARISIATLYRAGFDYARGHFASNFPERFIPARKSSGWHTRPAGKPNVSTRPSNRVFPPRARLSADKSRLLLRNKKLHIDTQHRYSRWETRAISFEI